MQFRQSAFMRGLLHLCDLSHEFGQRDFPPLARALSPLLLAALGVKVDAGGRRRQTLNQARMRFRIAQGPAQRMMRRQTHKIGQRILRLVKRAA